MLGTALLVLAIALAGGSAGAWSPTGFALVVVVAAVLAAVAAAAPATWRSRPGSPWPGIEVAGGLVAGLLGGLHLLEVAADLAGGMRGATPAAAAVALLLAAASGVLAAIVLARAPRATEGTAARVGATGAVVAALAVALGVTVGARSVGQLTALTLAATIGAATALATTRSRAGADVAMALSLVAALALWGVSGAIARGNFGPADHALFVAHVVGLALVVVAGGLDAVTRRSRSSARHAAGR